MTLDPGRGRLLGTSPVEKAVLTRYRASYSSDQLEQRLTTSAILRLQK
jgi:hypothetical protein